ncbi:MAG: EF-hand domain-containing protein [candidate division Zixibacteria bacterium]|nr:EF-hand domain-containing protein [candidate division Zixibacteria bacterium]
MIDGIQSMPAMSLDAMSSRGDQMFNKLDANGDGSLDSSEIQSFADMLSERTGQSIDSVELMSQLDTDGDGLVNKTEMEAARPDKSQFNNQAVGYQFQPPMGSDDTAETLMELLFSDENEDSINLLA